MAGGRPPEYNDQIVVRAKEYLASCVDVDYSRIKSEGDKSTSYDNHVKVKLPSIEGLALYLGINKDTIYQWIKIHTEFSDVYNEVMAEQAKRLLDNGLAGTYNSTIAKLILSKHGYREGFEHTGKDGKDLPTPIINVHRE